VNDIVTDVSEDKWLQQFNKHTPVTYPHFLTFTTANAEYDKVIAPELDKIDMIKELLHVKFGHSVLLHFDSADIDIVIEQLCME